MDIFISIQSLYTSVHYCLLPVYSHCLPSVCFRFPPLVRIKKLHGLRSQSYWIKVHANDPILIYFFEGLSPNVNLKMLPLGDIIKYGASNIILG